MASRELIGRPLVPFFDPNNPEVVNVSLVTNPNEQETPHEHIDIDARVWNKELGYFEYPTDQDTKITTKCMTSQTTVTTKVPHNNTLKTTTNVSTISTGTKMLLTPAMMLSSVHNSPESNQSSPDQIQIIEKSVHTVMKVDNNKQVKCEKSKMKLKSKSPNRSTTPTPSINGSLQSPTKPVKKDVTRSPQKKTSNQQQTKKPKQKPKEDLSASGKWAWSAFQSSPDPTKLPLPPMKMLSPVLVASNTTTEVTTMTITEENNNEENQTVTSIESEMTQDLRRMLNIGNT